MFIFQPDTTEWTGGVAPFKISLEGQNAACFKTTVPSSQPSSCITKCQILVWEKPIRTQLYRLTWSAWISSTGIFTLDKMQVLCGSPGEITTDGTSKAFCRWNQPPSGMFHSKLIDSLTSVLPFVWSIKREGRKTEGWWRIVGQRLEVGKKGSSGSWMPYILEVYFFLRPYRISRTRVSEITLYTYCKFLHLPFPF